MPLNTACGPLKTYMYWKVQTLFYNNFVCLCIQAAVERLEMDVERLTAENFRLKFAADTGYQVTGDDLLAAMSGNYL